MDYPTWTNQLRYEPDEKQMVLTCVFNKQYLFAYPDVPDCVNSAQHKLMSVIGTVMQDAARVFGIEEIMRVTYSCVRDSATVEQRAKIELAQNTPDHMFHSVDPIIRGILIYAYDAPLDTQIEFVFGVSHEGKIAIVIGNRQEFKEFESEVEKAQITLPSFTK